MPPPVLPQRSSPSPPPPVMEAALSTINHCWRPGKRPAAPLHTSPCLPRFPLRLALPLATTSLGYRLHLFLDCTLRKWVKVGALPATCDPSRPPIRPTTATTPPPPTPRWNPPCHHYTRTWLLRLLRQGRPPGPGGHLSSFLQGRARPSAGLGGGGGGPGGHGGGCQSLWATHSLV